MRFVKELTSNYEHSVCFQAQIRPGGPKISAACEYSPRVAGTRLDSLLVDRGLFESRARAARAVESGNVLVGDPGEPAQKPGQRVPADVAIEVTGEPQLASRGGEKLTAALDALALDPSGRRCLDVGASTGGFTDVLLRRGARHVVALDVASGELHPRLRDDPRVTVVDRSNAREVVPAKLPYRPDLLVADVSFISLTKVLPSVLACAADEFDCLALVKPQFEVGRERLGKGGVVRDPDDRRSALVAVGEAARELGFSVLGFASSGLPGPAGNQETFVWLAPSARGGVDDIEAAARQVEP
jgi:23S rRNA (cytidine1920-2'-O)/16S rRNA (cytidine1409-2'-O)-methyltransferase